jgi:predicted O-methyltransferase YrrM
LRKGGVLIADNVLWSGKVLEHQQKSADSETYNIKLFNELVKKEKHLETILLPIRDGLMVCRKV